LEWAMWLAIIPVTVAISLCYNILLSLLSDAAEDAQQGRVIGLSLAMAAVAFSISAISIGLLSSFNLRLVFVLMMLVAIIGFWRMLTINVKEDNYE